MLEKKRKEKEEMKIIQISLYVFVILIFGGSIYFSIQENDFIWFARCGSLLSIIPILISIIEFYSDRESIFYTKYNYAKYAPDNLDELAKNYWPIKIIINSVITIIGTFIWGFGDLLNKCF